MPNREPISVNNLDIYGSPPLEWSRARDQLANVHLSIETPIFLGTTRPDGRAHAVGIGAAWFDGDAYFTAGPGSRKARNLAANPACTLSMRLQGMDLVLEGTATRVTDSRTLEQLASLYQSGGWPAQVEGDALTAPYSAPSAGPAPWHLYRMTVHTAFGVGSAEPHGATRWRFSHQ